MQPQQFNYPVITRLGSSLSMEKLLPKSQEVAKVKVEVKVSAGAGNSHFCKWQCRFCSSPNRLWQNPIVLQCCHTFMIF